MVLTVDIGNSNIVIGGYLGKTLKFVSRITTNSTQTEDEYAVFINDLLKLNKIIDYNFSGAIISSVVPKLTPVIKVAVHKITGCNALTVSPGIKTGINIKTDDPSVLGADFVSASAGVLANYKLPAIVVDMGTATKVFALLEDGVFIGTSIMPGVNISLDALASKTAQLPHIGVDGNPPVIGTNTMDSMRSGIIYGSSSMIDGMIDKYKDELGRSDVTVIATGGIASSIIKYCKHDILLDEMLILKGLISIYRRNS